MIVLDTHIWVWWVDESPQLSERHSQLIQANEQSGLGSVRFPVGKWQNW
jgi:PIN domain nuclease of toxin-antitoxin system